MLTSEQENLAFNPLDSPKSVDLLGNQFACLVNFFLPGFGQFSQKRYMAFAVQLFVFAMVCLLYKAIGHIATISHIALVMYSVLDAASWNGQRRQNAWMANLCVIMLFLSFPFAFLVHWVVIAQEEAKRMQCSCSFKGVVLAMHNYHDTYGSLPPAYTVDANGRPLHSWRVLILPFIEQKDLYEKIRLDEPWDSEHNRQFHDVDVHNFYQCSSAEGRKEIIRGFPNLRKKGACYKSVIVGENTAFPGAESRSFADLVPTAETILILERLLPVCWMDPGNEITYEIALKGINREYNGIGSFHKDGAYISRCDGSVMFLPENTTREELEYLIKTKGR